MADPQDWQATRLHEVVTTAPLPQDAGVAFIGHVETPWSRREDCPRQGSTDGPDCALVLAEPWDQALLGIEGFTRLEVLTWLHLSRRDLLVQNPAHSDSLRGTFSLRSPVRPNPIGLTGVALLRREVNRLIVRGMDCVSGTPLIDIKPDRCQFTPVG